MTRVLAIETSTANCAVSIVGEGECYSIQHVAPQQHAQLILPMIEQALAETGLNASQLDLLAFGEGPGAFTGLRIAAGVVQGLALGWQKPVVAISSLEALAFQGFQQTQHLTWLACLDARMGEVYSQSCHFSPQGDLIASSAAILSKPDSVKLEKNQRGVGDIAEAYPALVSQFDSWLNGVPNAESVAYLALQRADQAQDVFEQIPQPVYLRPSVS